MNPESANLGVVRMSVPVKMGNSQSIRVGVSRYFCTALPLSGCLSPQF